ncbi:MAG: energy transducer TonB [Nitrospirota bacterium]|nr:energy transducer TonB [Nitrospirota bacterium]
MIAAEPHRSGTRKEAHSLGWLVSILLHGAVALIALILVTQAQLSPQDDPFKWNVAMVSPTQPVTATTSPPHQSTAPSVSPPPPTPASPLQQNVPTQPLAAPQPLAQQTTPSIAERTAVTPMVADPPAPMPLEPATPSQSVAHTARPVEPIRHEAVVPKTPEASPIQKPAEEPPTVPVPSDTHAAPSPPPATPVSPPTQAATHSPIPAPLTDAAPTQTAASAQAPANAPIKRDYGWLSETILRRVEELKRYPASARAERAEGKVVVKAVINEDGSIGEMEVFQSSGHPVLDKAAMDTMKQAAPFHLPHPLGQPRMTIKIPMSYRLDR